MIFTLTDIVGNIYQKLNGYGSNGRGRFR